MYVRAAADIYRLLAYNVLRDSVELSLTITPGHGDMQLSRNGDVLYFTNPGTIGSINPPASAIYILDIVSNRVIDSITTAGLLDQNGQDTQYLPIRFLTLTPGATNLIAVAGPARGIFLDYDIGTRTIKKCINLGDSILISSVGCQAGF